MSDAIEEFWRSIKRAAQRRANGPRLSHREAAAIVRALAAEHRLDPVPPPEAMAFYAVELLAMTNALHEADDARPAVHH